MSRLNRGNGFPQQPAVNLTIAKTRDKTTNNIRVPNQLTPTPMKTALQLLVLVFTLLCSVDSTANGLALISQNESLSQGSITHPIRMSASVDINDQIVTNTVRESFKQTSLDSAYFVYGYPMLNNGSVSSVRLWIDGKEFQTGVSGNPVDTSKKGGSGGGTVQKSALQQHFDALGYTQTAFQMPLKTVIKKNSIVEIEIKTIELLSYSLGSTSFVFPWRALANNPYLSVTKDTTDFRFTLHLKSSSEISSIASINHAFVTFATTASQADAGVSLLGRSNTLMYDFKMQYSVLISEVKSAFYSNKPSNEDGHFAFLLRPSTVLSGTSVLPKVFTFIIDVSGSMLGTKIQQAREAANFCVTHLNPSDRFNVIAFSTGVGRFEPAPVPASAENVNKAVEYISALRADGGTNLQDAALSGLEQYTDTSTVNIIIFLTDGIAQLDQSLVQQRNTSHVRICVFGVGNDVNSAQLSTLAALNNGIAQFITEASSTSEVVSAFYKRVRYPIWRNLSLTVSPVNVYDVLPAIIPDLNVGEQLNIAGRYKELGPATIRVHGFADGQVVDRDYPVVFSADSTTDAFCPKIWARMRIDFLLQLMNKEGSQTARWNEWRNEIIRLGIRYGLVTQFTCYQDTGTVSDVENDALAVSILSIYPNPCSQKASFRFNVENTESVWLTVYDMRGREVFHILNGELLSGAQEVHWDLRDAQGAELPAGSYVCALRIGHKEHIMKLSIVR